MRSGIRAARATRAGVTIWRTPERSPCSSPYGVRGCVTAYAVMQRRVVSLSLVTVLPEHVVGVGRRRPRRDFFTERHARALMAQRVVRQLVVKALVCIVFSAARVRQRLERRDVVVDAIAPYSRWRNIRDLVTEPTSKEVRETCNTKEHL